MRRALPPRRHATSAAHMPASAKPTASIMPMCLRPRHRRAGAGGGSFFLWKPRPLAGRMRRAASAKASMARKRIVFSLLLSLAMARRRSTASTCSSHWSSTSRCQVSPVKVVASNTSSLMTELRRAQPSARTEISRTPSSSWRAASARRCTASSWMPLGMASDSVFKKAAAARARTLTLQPSWKALTIATLAVAFPSNFAACSRTSACSWNKSSVTKSAARLKTSLETTGKALYKTTAANLRISSSSCSCSTVASESMTFAGSSSAPQWATKSLRAPAAEMRIHWLLSLKASTRIPTVSGQRPVWAVRAPTGGSSWTTARAK
mmetsp:Transcript_37699/g.108413  ORF Transcript_37699/g.108413 Transcript_37699/m.108413 type:complete len:322 (-) Transcript_37699:1370-2335(-)